MKCYDSIIIYNFFFNLFLEILSQQLGNNTGAYLKTPDPSKLQYRAGNALSTDEKYEKYSIFPDLVKNAGFNTIRKKFKEIDFEEELNFLNRSKELGISDMIGYLTTPINDHSSKENENSDKCKPSNLYEPIWLSDFKVNPNNFWANYTFNTITKYKDYIKIWTIWNKPDFTSFSETNKKWILHPPNPSDLSKWNATIFEFIRMMRITYEIAKKIDPECWVAVSTLSHYEFLDALMRYTDNPDNGEINIEYPDYGGAYFDCVGFIKNPKGGIIDIEGNKTYNKNGSDSLVQKIYIAKKNFENITRKYGFGINYPAKIFINDETSLVSKDSCNALGGETMRKNWIIKLSLLSLEYDIKQNHNKNLFDLNDCGSGDYYPIDVEKKEDIFLNLKTSSEVRKILRKINLEKYVFERNKTFILRQNLPEDLRGIVLKRQFPKEKDDEYNYNYIYSLWRFCEDKEIQGTIEYELNIPFNALMINYNGNKINEINITNSTKIKISSTPLFLLGNIENEKKEEKEEKKEKKKNEKNEEENFNNKLKFIVIFCVVILAIAFMLLLFFLCRKFKRKQNIGHNNINNNINKIDLLDKFMD